MDRNKSTDHVLTNANKFDRMAVDVDAVYARVPLGTKRSRTSDGSGGGFKALYRTFLLPLKLRRYLSRLLRRTHVDVTWFTTFASYWSQVLGGRPLATPHDLYVLKNLYRAQFQGSEVAVEDTPDPRMHLQAWQRPEVLYQLLHLVEKEALFDPTGLFQRMLRHVRPKVVLEFGCGTAPIVSSMRQFGFRSIRAYIADIKTIAFHYAGYRLADDPNVTPILLDAETGFSLPHIEPVDAIFCVAVFEHLNRPLATVQALHRVLRPGGVLAFDYIKSEGGGLDTHHGVRERRDVLEFVREHFDMVEGSLDFDESMRLSFARKRA